MASSGGDVPAERAAAAVNDLLVEAREGVERLKSFLLQLEHRAPWAELVADGVLSRLSNAMATLDGAGAAAGGQSPATPSDGSRPQPSASSSGNTRKRSFSRRSQRSSDQKITPTLDDGHIWRKYGQKEIQNSPHPRSYFRCTHKTDQGCNATRHVQVYEADPSKYVVTYYGEHTCGDPSRFPPLVIHGGGEGAGNLISFAPSHTNNVVHGTGASTSQLAMELSTSWCTTSDDMFSSSGGSFMQVDELGAVVGSAGVVSSRTAAAGSAPDSGGLGDLMPGLGGGGTGAASFHSSPNSLGFVVGSLGSIGDDDFFQLEMDPEYGIEGKSHCCMLT
ncbi:EcWRKY-27, partial [Eragrostis curvula]